MNNFSNIIEGRNRTSLDGVNLLSHEIADYTKKMSKKLPQEVTNTIYLLQKYGITSGETVDEILVSNSGRLKTMAVELNITYQDIQDIKATLQKLGNNIKLLPMKMSEREREELIAGRKAMDDLTIDLETEKGRSAVIKQYGPLVYKIANQFIGKENLDKAELISVGFEGLTQAMNTYQKPVDKSELEDDAEREEAEKAKRTSFKTWASYKIRWAILGEIYDNSRTIRMSYNDRRNAYTKGETTNLTTSLDSMAGKDGEEGSMQDHIAGLATTDTLTASEQQKRWDKLFDELGKHFSKRDMVVFLKYFGLGGEKEEKGKDIAAEFNMTPAMVTHIVTKKILPYIKSNEDLMDIMGDLLAMRVESLMVNNMYKSGKELYEALLGDDVYLMLEEITRWRNPGVLFETVAHAMETLSDTITGFLKGDENFATNNYKDNLKEVKEFLTNLYPTESFIRKPDEYILERLLEIINLWHKYEL